MNDEMPGITDAHSSSLTVSEERVTMTDRTAQARDAYWNTHPHTGGPALDMNTLRFGVEWADANPKPHTITQAQTALLDRLEALANGFHYAGDLPAEKSLRGWIEDARERIEGDGDE